MVKKETKGYKKANKGTIITILIVVAIVLVIALSITLSFFSGRHDGIKYKTYTENDIQYKLPQNFKPTNYGYGELEYSDGEGAYFFFTAFDETELAEDQFLPTDITVQAFAQSLITAWCVDSEYVYNPENDSVTFDYYIEESGEYYRHLVIWGSEELFLFTVSCNSSDVEKHASMLDFVIDSIVVP